MKLINLTYVRVFNAIKAGNETVESFSATGINRSRGTYKLTYLPDWGVIQISEPDSKKPYIVCVTMANVIQFIPEFPITYDGVEKYDKPISAEQFLEPAGKVQKTISAANQIEKSKEFDKSKPPLPKSK